MVTLTITKLGIHPLILSFRATTVRMAFPTDTLLFSANMGHFLYAFTEERKKDSTELA